MCDSTTLRLLLYDVLAGSTNANGEVVFWSFQLNLPNRDCLLVSISSMRPSYCQDVVGFAALAR